LLSHPVLQVEPGVFRNLHTFMQDTTNRTGRIEVLSFAVTAMDAGGSEDFNTLPAAAAPVAAAAADGAAAASTSGRHADAAAGGISTPSRQQHPARPHSGTAGAAEAGAGAGAGGAAAGGRVLYAKGPIAGLPEEFASRKERFAELDQLQAGWAVELRSRGDTVDAVFYAPDGTLVGTYATARRQALAAHKAGKA
jgi:hypothetical protein